MWVTFLLNSTLKIYKENDSEKRNRIERRIKYISILPGFHFNEKKKGEAHKARGGMIIYKNKNEKNSDA